MTEHFAPADDRKPIPSFQFSTEAIAAKEQFDGYRDFMRPLSDVEPLAPPVRGFRAHARVYDLGRCNWLRFITIPPPSAIPKSI